MSKSNIEMLIEVVQNHYEHSPRPLFLSALGAQFKELREKLVGEYGSLLAAIKSIPADTLEIVNDDQPGSIVVVTPEKKRDVVARLVKPMSETLFDGLPAPLRIAFCLKSEAGQVVGIKLTPPMKYQKFDSGTVLPPGFLPIDGKYRVPGLDLRVASAKEKERLFKEFLSWADEHNIDPDRLRKNTPQTNALERLIAVQPPEILSKMVLPVDIVAILVRHS